MISRSDLAVLPPAVRRRVRALALQVALRRCAAALARLALLRKLADPRWSWIGAHSRRLGLHRVTNSCLRARRTS